LFVFFSFYFFFLVTDYNFSDSDDDDGDVALFASLQSLSESVKKSKAPKTPTISSNDRFSLENLILEQSNRKEVRRHVSALDSDDEDDDDDDDDDLLLGMNTSRFKQIVDEENLKTPDDLDLCPFFHHWKAEDAEGFYARMPWELPSSLSAVLEGASSKSAKELMKLILVGNFIPAFFPDRCPADLAVWLFKCMCFARETQVSAAAWDVWTYYFNRPALWDPEDASFGWFQDQVRREKVKLEWIPDWKTIVETLKAFGAPTKVYEGAKVYPKTANIPRDDPPLQDHTYAPQKTSATDSDGTELSPLGFPAARLRRFFSVLGLCFYASSAGRLLNGQAVYEERHSILLTQICLAAMVDPMMLSSPKRELTQCICAVLEVFPQENSSNDVLCDYIMLLTPHKDYLPIVSALTLFTPPTKRAQWIRRVLSFKMCCLLLEEMQQEDELNRSSLGGKKKKKQSEPFPRALDGNVEMLQALLEFLPLLEQACISPKKWPHVQFVKLYRLCLCLDFVVGDRSAICADEALSRNIEEEVRKVLARLKSIQVEEFAICTRTTLLQMAERIYFNRDYEENRARSLKKAREEKKLKDSIERRKSGGDQTSLSFGKPEDGSFHTTPTRTKK
jgi:hypothetical protein